MCAAVLGDSANYLIVQSVNSGLLIDKYIKRRVYFSILVRIISFIRISYEEKISHDDELLNEKKKENEISNNHLISQYKITVFTLSLSTSSSSCLLSC